MQSIIVQGMVDEQCREAVGAAIKSVSGVSSVSVDLKKGAAHWTEADKLDNELVKKAIRKAGYSVP